VGPAVAGPDQDQGRDEAQQPDYGAAEEGGLESLGERIREGRAAARENVVGARGRNRRQDGEAKRPPIC
jgi:hypothetical protein